MADVVVENTEELVVNEEDLENEDIVVVDSDEEETSVVDEGRTFVSEEDAQIAEEAAEQARQWAVIAEQQADIATDKAAEVIVSAESASADAALAKQWAIGEPTEPNEHSAKYWATQAKFGMTKKFFSASDWTQNGTIYKIVWDYNIISSVYRKDNTTYELVTNIDIETTDTQVTIYSPTAFEGYALLVKGSDEVVDKTFVFEQGVASDTWVIEHNLNKHPSVTFVDSAGTEFDAEVQHNSNNICTAYMNGATTGKAFLN